MGKPRGILQVKQAPVVTDGVDVLLLVAQGQAGGPCSGCRGRRRNLVARGGCVGRVETHDTLAKLDALGASPCGMVVNHSSEVHLGECTRMDSGTKIASLPKKGVPKKR